MSKVAIILPSRGLIFSRTAEEIIRNARDINYKFFFAHKLPIPKCFNEPTERALKDKTITHLLFVEDDMVIPDGVFFEMLNKDKAVVTADYPITKDGRGSVFRDADGRVLYCGTGCLMVKREVFDELKKPYFHTNLKWNVKNFGEFIKFTAVSNDTKDGYGLHDITFCFEMLQKGIPIHVIDTRLGQRKLLALGKQGSNNGAHQIETWRKIIKNKKLKEIQSYRPEQTGDLITVVTPSGELLAKQDHAEKLVEAGLGEIPPKRASIISWGEL